MSKPDILVIGGGLGGLAAAVRLRAAGCVVTLVEKNPLLGGRLGEIREAGCRWDMEPEPLTMPFVLHDLFTDANRRASDYLTLERIDPVRRHFWKDGTVLEEDAAFLEQPEVRRFLRHLRGLHELVGETSLHQPPQDLWRAFAPGNWARMGHLPKLLTAATVAGQARGWFRDPQVRQVFQCTGSDPWRMPAQANFGPFLESEFGSWRIRGGTARLADALAGLAAELGIWIRTGVRAERIDEKGVRLSDGSCLQPGAIVCNGDVARMHRDVIRHRGWVREFSRLAAEQRSLSKFVLFLAVDRRWERLGESNVFHSEDPEAEMRDLFQRRRFPANPTMRVDISARTGPEDAPEGWDNYVVSVQAPAEIRALDWETMAGPCADQVIEGMERRGLAGLAGHIKHRRIFTPADFAAHDLSWHGSRCGGAVHSLRGAFCRPPLRSPLAANLFFAGRTVHPGGGLPQALLSGRMAADEILSGACA
jgi:diapolycopene oxygenase